MEEWASNCLLESPTSGDSQVGEASTLYQSHQQDRSGYGIYGRRFNPSGVIVPINNTQTGISDNADVAKITVNDRAYDSSFTK